MPTASSAVDRWCQRHTLALFYVIAYAVSWSIAVPLALQAHGHWPFRVPLWMHYLTAFGPAAAALIVSRLRRSAPTRGSRRAEGTHPSFWWGLVGLSPLLLFAGAGFVLRFVGAPAPSWSSLGRVNFLPDLGVAAWLLWFVTSGVGEETGWRGCAIPTLQRRHTALASSAWLALAWGGWHLPAFFYVPGYAAILSKGLPGFFVGLLAGSIVLTWLYNVVGGRLLPVMLWHASFNFVTGSPNAAGLTAAIVSSLVIVWAAILVWRNGRSFSTRSRPSGRAGHH
jgi:membrane protease YdiL (CAAX protease family)